MSEQDKTLGSVEVINAVTLTVDQRDGDGYISEAHGATTPTAASLGFASGCEFTNTTTDKKYVNEGDEASCDFQVVIAGSVTAADLGTDSVDSDEIKASAVGTSEIADGAVAPVDQSAAARTRSVTIPFSLPAPTGSNQGPLTRAGFKTAQAMTVVSVKIGSSTDSVGSDGTNNYSFMPKNATLAANLHTGPTNTQGAELNDGTLKNITVSQNLAFAADQEFAIDVNIADDGGAGPTSLTAASLYCVLEYTI